MRPRTSRRPRQGRRWLLVGFLSVAIAGPGTAAAADPVPAPPPEVPSPPAPPSGTTIPTTTTTVPSHGPNEPDTVGETSDDKPGFFDFGGRIRNSINEWFRGLVSDSLSPVLDLVTRTVFASPDVSEPGRVRELWSVSRVIANGMFVLFVAIGGFTLMGQETFQTQYTLKELLPRMVLGWLGANLSLMIVGAGVRLANAMSGVFLSAGGTDRETAMEGLRTLAIEPLGTGGGIPILLLSLAVVVLAIGIVGTYVVRVANLVVLAVAGPLVLAAYALPRGEGAARLWWRALIGCLLVQIGQALILASAITVLFDADGKRALGIPGGPFMDVVVLGCLFWLLLQLPTYAGRLVFAPRPTQLARTYLLGRGVRGALGAGR